MVEWNMHKNKEMFWVVICSRDSLSWNAHISSELLISVNLISIRINIEYKYECYLLDGQLVLSSRWVGYYVL